jgi:membrane associated rhomboid family serine protease
MVSEGPAAGDRFALRDGREVALYESGLRHPVVRFGRLGRAESFTPLGDVLHVGLGRKSLRLSARAGLLVLPRSAFLDESAALGLGQALLARIAALPDGETRLEAMERLDDRLRHPVVPRAARIVTLLCMLAFVGQLFWPAFEAEAIFGSFALPLGEWWRLATFQVLHGGPGHLFVNAVGLLVLGGLLERCVGSVPTALVMAVSAAGAAAASVLASYELAVGASGVVAGIMGALTWLEFRHPEAVPAPWRLPRGLLVGALVADGLLLQLVPGIAHAAHLGGFLAGGSAMALVGIRVPGPVPLWQRAAVAASVAWLVLSLGAVGRDVLAGPEILERRAGRLLALDEDDVSAMMLNDHAWIIAISDSPQPALLDLALGLAERAVAQTERNDPNILDTLAEVHFQRGDTALALHVIDEAIALRPQEPYFREQRRRYRGERERDDLPPPPGSAPPLPEPPGLPEPESPDLPGIRV